MKYKTLKTINKKGSVNDGLSDTPCGNCFKANKYRKACHNTKCIFFKGIGARKNILIVLAI